MSEGVIDSIIVDELARIKYPGGDEAYYEEVHRILPNYDGLEDEFDNICGYLLERGWI